MGMSNFARLIEASRHDVTGRRAACDPWSGADRALEPAQQLGGGPGIHRQAQPGLLGPHRGAGAGPQDAVDLVFSGHTHGGQVGLVSLGFNWTVLSRSRWPDHGLFGRGRSRLYVHRGTGFYGFPLRLGVPGEASVMEINWPGAEWASVQSEPG